MNAVTCLSTGEMQVNAMTFAPAPRTAPTSQSTDRLGQLFADLESIDADVRKTAAQEAGRVLYRLTSMLAGKLSDNAMCVRQAAARATRELGPAVKAALPNLIEALADEDWLVRLWAVHALSALGPAAQPAAAVLRQSLQDPVRYVRTAAFVALACIEKGN